MPRASWRAFGPRATFAPMAAEGAGETRSSTQRGPPFQRARNSGRHSLITRVPSRFLAPLARSRGFGDPYPKAFQAPIISRLIAEADAGVDPLARAPVVELAEACMRKGDASVLFGV